MPTNMTATSRPMTVSVTRAFRHSGGWKAGTPLEMASTPVIALQPSANARMSRSRPSDSTGTSAAVTPVTLGASPSRERATPMPMRASVVVRKTYVGSAKIVPLSRIPRRFTSMTAAMRTAAMSTRWSASDPGTAEVMAATPAATLTATVRT